MKKDDNIPITKEKKIYLIGGAIAAVIVIIVLCILIWRKNFPLQIWTICRLKRPSLIKLPIPRQMS